ncbi:Piso0_005745 [Millerozyma farinosa CBS 7064]|uniref:Piso0_005745 protein n=1 Tax=Pichia sorbitophila (strain ATCC MYA-4447 / BCRC 22081 / CBS 7064 / NBRC 10061 / NRRL Y-12695) TaxID=559304 RepID=G8Y2T4_PICSO|nr:Piso0_005745 [Millerozyma farinosa CBS 7064]
MHHMEPLLNQRESLQKILSTVPFDADKNRSTNYFLNVYRLNHDELYRLTEEEKFPLDAEKLLKLGISLGNLLKSLQQDDDSYRQQEQHQDKVNARNRINKSNAANSDLQNPFLMENVISSSPIPVHYIKFIRNLFNILKNFDIGSHNSMNQVNMRLHSIASQSSNSTMSKSAAGSPIKINSRQLLIEKLEINIKLDGLFVYKMIFQILLRVNQNLELHLQAILNRNAGGSGSPYGNSEEQDIRSPGTENSSIFSSTSNTSDASLSQSDYSRLIVHCLARITNGLIDPFINSIICNVMTPTLKNEINSLLSCVS